MSKAHRLKRTFVASQFVGHIQASRFFAIKILGSLHAKAKVAGHPVKPFGTHHIGNLCKHDVRRLNHRLFHIHVAIDMRIANRLVASDFRVIFPPIPALAFVFKYLIGRNNVVFKGRGRCNHLEGGTRFVRHRHDIVFRHTAHTLFLGIRVKSRIARHGKDFARVGVHHHSRGTGRTEFIHAILERLFDNFLHVLVDGEHQVLSGFCFGHVFGAAINFTFARILNSDAETFVTTETQVKDAFHAHASDTIVADLPHDLRGKFPLQENAAVVFGLARIAEVLRKYDSVSVQNFAAFRIDILGDRHRAPCFGLVNFTVQHLDSKGLPHEYADNAVH